MADQTMVVTECTGDPGLLDITAMTNVLHGNAALTDSFFMPNDGKVILVVISATGDTYTFTPVADKFGRTETRASICGVGTAVIGPFNPDIWNQSNGCIKFKATAAVVGDHLLAVRVGTPT